MVRDAFPKFGESPLHCTGDSDECFLHSTDFADISPHSQLKYPDDYNMKLLYSGKIKHRKNALVGSGHDCPWQSFIFAKREKHSL